MPRILLACAESILCERLRQAFQSHTEFEVYGADTSGARMISLPSS
jgi:hypothetical protein